MPADSRIKNPIFSFVPSHSFYHLGKKVLSSYLYLHDCVNRQKVMDSVAPATFDEFMNFPVKITSMCMSQGLTVLKLYLNVTPLLMFNANYKR